MSLKYEPSSEPLHISAKYLDDDVALAEAVRVVGWPAHQHRVNLHITRPKVCTGHVLYVL